MIDLLKKDLPHISGGNVFQAVGVGIAVYTAWPSIIDSTSYWNNLGSNVGEWAFDTLHPNQLGQMEYAADEFGQSYIAPAFPNEFPPHRLG